MSFLDQGRTPLLERVKLLNWQLISLVLILSLLGFLMLYSAGGGHFRPWLIRQLVFFIIFMFTLVFLYIINYMLTIISLFLYFS